ncbi:MAG: hypothetical protein BroJett018_49470 [Chloroflexota bacterium]|nr:MAG: hypothetical protein BroJett018_49470 [Chloroflexota bacterium]
MAYGGGESNIIAYGTKKSSYIVAEFSMMGFKYKDSAFFGKMGMLSECQFKKPL